MIVHYENPLHIYIPLGSGKEGSFIKSVAIDQTPFSLQRGTNANLTATVAGNAEDKSVTWSVSGNNSEATTISADGALQIASDETADKVTLTATSVYDTRKSDSIEVTVTEDAPEISAVTFIEPVTGIQRRGTATYQIKVEGTETDRSLNWSVTGNTSPNTKVKPDSASSATLVIGGGETGSVVLRATSVKDPEKWAEQEITILPSTVLNEISLTYDAQKLQLNDTQLERDAAGRLLADLSVKTEGLDAYYPHMIYYYDSGEWTFEQDVNSTWNEQYVSIDREYFFRCNIALNNGYDWNEEMQGVDGTKKVGDMKTFSVYVNGKLCKDATITYYGAETNYMELAVPLGKGQCAHQYDYKSNNNGTHDYTCTKNNDSTGTEACSYVNGYCEKCNHHAHEYNAEMTTKPTCTKEGLKTYTCKWCKDSYTEKVAKSGHDYQAAVTKQPTCNAEGVKTYTCTRCKDSYTEKMDKLAHSYQAVVTKATEKADGTITNTCEKCKHTASKTTIPKIAKVQMTKKDLVYNGKKQTPAVTVTDSKGKVLKNGTDYKVTYPKNRKNVGVYTAKVTFKGNYTGTKSLKFRIDPKKTSLKKLEAQKKGFQVTWKKQTSQTTGYQIQYSTKKNFKKNVKSITVKKNSKTSATVSKLSAKKKYYVRIRTYKTVKVNGKHTKLYSDWSSVKNVKTKK